MRRSALPVAVLLALATLLAAAAALADQADDGPWTQMIMVYTGDVGGKIEPCG